MAKPEMLVLDETIQALNDEQLGDLVQRLVGECRRRGDAATEALRAAIEADLTASGLDAEERAGVAARAASREAQRLREEEAGRVAAEAADRLRREREAEKVRREEDKNLRQAERLRSLAQRARGLLGHDVSEFSVHVWSKDGEQRVYIGMGYDANWVEYYHTGSARIIPGTVKFPAAVDRPLAEHLGCTRDEAKERIKAFCGELCREWRSLRLEVTESNAPRDPACRVQRWVLQHENSKNYIGRFRPDRSPVLTGSAQDAAGYGSREEAESALVTSRANGGGHLDGYVAVERQVWLAYPPKTD